LPEGSELWEQDGFFEQIMKAQASQPVPFRGSGISRPAREVRVEVNPMDNPEGFADPEDWEDWEPPESFPYTPTLPAPTTAPTSPRQHTTNIPRPRGKFADLPRDEDR